MDERNLRAAAGVFRREARANGVQALVGACLLPACTAAFLLWDWSRWIPCTLTVAFAGWTAWEGRSLRRYHLLRARRFEEDADLLAVEEVLER